MITKRSCRRHYAMSGVRTTVGLTKFADGRFSPVDHSTPSWNGRDEAKAIHRFRRWCAARSNGAEPLTLHGQAVRHGRGFERRSC